MRAPALADLSRRPLLDLKTTAVIVLMVLGFPAAGWACHVGHLPLWAGALVGTFLMNLSFTAWHEPAHGNLSRSKAINTAAGVLASWASVYPGYFARRREHLIHHRYEGQPELDPVFPRIQSTHLGFFFTLFRVALLGESWNAKVPATYLPYTGAQRAADMLSNLLALAVVVASVPLGCWQAALAVWVVPRAVVLLAHAYYVCYLPHSVPGGGFVLYRVRPGAIRWLLTMGQSLHGLHHKWPAVPWHRYGTILRRFPDEVQAAGVEGVAPTQ